MSTSRPPLWLLLVGAMTALGPVSIDMYLPGFPAIEQQFGSTGVEGTMAAFLMGLVVGQLVYGPISDSLGRKPPLYVGLVLYIIGSLGCAFSTNMMMLSAMRVLQALGGCAGMVIGRAIVRDRCEPHEAARAFSTLMMIVALGPVLAPAIGGVVVEHFGWRATFMLQAALAVLMMVMMHRALEETRERASAPPLRFFTTLRDYAGLLVNAHFVGHSLLMGFAMGAMFSYVTGAPNALTHLYQLSPQQFGALIGLNGLSFMLASRLNMVGLRTRGPAQLLARYIWMPPLFGMALLGLSLLVSLPLWGVVSLQLLMFVTIGRINPNVAALALAPHGRHAGTASALLGATQSLVTMLAGLAVAVFSDDTITTLAAIMTSCAVLAWLSYVWVRRLGGAGA